MRQTRKKGCHLGLHLDSHFIFRLFDSECRGHFYFLLIYRQFLYNYWSAKLPQISHSSSTCLAV